MEILCPNCNKALIKNGGVFRCENNHSFDIAKEGYINLLPLPSKNSKNPGDNIDMVDARHHFLSHGYFDLVAEKIAVICMENIKEDAFILDAGCADGFYTKKIYEKTLSKNILGIDISKFQIKKASKGEKNILYVVASSYNLPIKDNIVDLLITIFAPRTKDFLRVIKSGGFLLIAKPNTYHLDGLKKNLYEDVIYKEEFVENVDGFSLVLADTITYEICVQSEDILNLVKMTPYYYKSPKEAIENLKNLENLKTNVDIMINLYKKL